MNKQQVVSFIKEKGDIKEKDEEIQLNDCMKPVPAFRC